MKTVLIIQARMGSTRLPGKVMKEVLNRPLLAHLLDRMLQIPGVDIKVATSTHERDQPIVDLARKMGVLVFRGDEEDVLSRYVDASQGYDAVVRVTADCPLLDADVVEEALARFKSGKCEYLSNTIERTYPRGYDVEILTREALLRIDQKASGDDREHVTSYVAAHQDEFNVDQFKQKSDFSSIRLTVDTLEDFELIKRIFETLPEGFAMEDVVDLLDQHPYLKELNRGVEQKGPF